MIGYLSMTEGEDALFLSKIYIEADFRGKGIGKKSMDFIEGIARERKLGKIMLTVNKRNVTAIKAYQKYGFVVKDSPVMDIGGGFVMDDYKMEKLLVGPSQKGTP